MKLQKIALVLLVLFSMQICFGQNQNKSVLVDKFGKIGGDELQSRLVNFMNILIKNKSRGLIVLNETKESRIAMYINEQRIQKCLAFGKYHTENLSFVFAERMNETLEQFWEIPNNAQKPAFKELPHDYKIQNLSKPQFVYSLNAEGVCENPPDIQFYSRFLKANPNIVGKIIIHEKSVSKFQKEKLKYFRELTGKENVAPRQIKFVEEKYNGASDAEFWLVPVKKKQ